MSSSYEADHCSDGTNSSVLSLMSGLLYSFNSSTHLSPGATAQHKHKDDVTLPSRSCVAVFICLLCCVAWSAICSVVRRKATHCLLFPRLGMFNTNNNKHNLCAHLIRPFFLSNPSYQGEFGAVFLQSVF